MAESHERSVEIPQPSAADAERYGILGKLTVHRLNLVIQNESGMAHLNISREEAKRRLAAHKRGYQRWLEQRAAHKAEERKLAINEAKSSTKLFFGEGGESYV